MVQCDCSLNEPAFHRNKKTIFGRWFAQIQVFQGGIGTVFKGYVDLISVVFHGWWFLLLIRIIYIEGYDQWLFIGISIQLHRFHRL